MHLRAETLADIPHVRRVTEAAFGREDEARLVDRLRAESPDAISVVADIDGELAGHVMLSPMRAPEGAMGLAPVSVRPDLHGKGVGTALVREALDRARAAGWKGVFVLGDPPYYARFGFHTQTARGYASSYSGPFLMGLELEAGALSGEGELSYARAFDDLAE
ncbi:MAG: GNAT family N-acetyltransferase [Rhodobacteraceae bacterium]|nr:GNAT family N-acetyltransferase [Paracoccaceae bacterium]MBR27801.1 GNAT family N-acetyltransferase [Paracoccaceae bacterium]|tara:strand:+ start:44 stop:532 length:489 start_codon:yes stop_codon:yes gene_type:complete